MGVTNYINIPVFLISLALGLIFIAVFNPSKRTIFVYPTPENVGTIQYKDAAGNCFEFEQTKTTCPAESKIAVVPVQP
jgi:hypothetical protein